MSLPHPRKTVWLTLSLIMIYCFDEYKLDIPRRELLFNGKQVSLRPKVFALLVFLVEQRDRVVDRQTLFNEVWPGRIVSDATLSSCIKELRKALNDNEIERRYISTVHGQGFRFIAMVEKTTADVEDHKNPVAPTVVQEQTPLSSTPTLHPRSPERKTVSALRCALLDADSSAERLGPELTYRIMQVLLKDTRDTVERYGGNVTQWLSDGCLALFGASVSHDDDARRAVLAAADLLECCRTVSEKHGVAFACGVTSGIAVIGGVPGGPNQHYSASGALLRHAEELCFAANDGETIIDAVTYPLVREDVRAQPYTTTPRVRITDESKSTTVSTEGLADAWRVKSIIGTRAGVPRRFRRALTKMVGRERELLLIRDRFKDACSQRGQCVALVGSAGIGKTRLFDEFRTHFANTASTIVVRCLPELQNKADFLLHQCALALAAPQSGTENESIDSRLCRVAETAGIDDELSQSLLLSLVSQSPKIAPDLSLSAQAQRDIVENTLIRLLFSADDVRVLIVEDLHWMDASSAAWLSRVVRRLGSQCFLLLASYRSGTSPDWLRNAGVTQLPLAPLTQSATIELLNALPSRKLDYVAQRHIIDSSGGNPYLLSELALQGPDSGDLPVTVQAVLSARIDELCATDKRVLQSASAIGLRVELMLLDAVCDIPTDTLREAIERLQENQLLDTEFDVSQEWLVFRHALIQEAAYSMLLSDERRRLHQRVATCFDTKFAKTYVAHPEIIAWHYEEAGHCERAARFWQRAAFEASVRCAYVETTAYVQRSLALHSAVKNAEPDSQTSRNPYVREHVELELALLNSLGHAQMATHGYASKEVEQTWTKAQCLCEDLDDDVSLFRVLVGLGNYYLASGEVRRVALLNRRLANIARRLRNSGMRIRARAAMGELMLHLGRIDSSVRHFEACISLFNEMDGTNFLGNSAVVLAHSHLAWARFHMGQESAALVHNEQALSTAHSSDKPILLAMALGMSAKLHRFRDDPARAAKLAMETIQIAEQQRFTYWHGSALVTLGWTQARTGDTTKALSTIGRGFDLISVTGERLMQPMRLGALADAQRMHGLHTLATATLNQALELARSTGERFCLRELRRVLQLLEGNTKTTKEGEYLNG